MDFAGRAPLGRVGVMALVVIRANRQESHPDHSFVSFCHVIESARTFRVMGGWSSHKAIWFTRPVKIHNRWW